MIIVNDTFTAADNTAITGRSTDSGHTWSAWGGSANNAKIIGNKAVSQLSSNDAYFSSAVPSGAEYDVECVVESTSYAGGPCGRLDAGGAVTGYVVEYAAGGSNRWELWQYVAGVSTQLGTYSGDVPTTPRTVKLQIRDATKKVFIGGVERISSATNAITAAGRPGFHMGGTSGSDSIDTFTYDDLAAADTTPDAFSFTDQTAVALSAVITSNTITVAGINSAATVTITGGEWQKNGGAWGSSSGSVNNGDTVAVRHTSAAAGLTATNTVLTVGGVSDTFTSTTADVVPDAFTFVDQSGVALSATITSASVTVSGITGAAAVTVSGGEWQKNGGAWGSSAGTVVNGDAVAVRHTSSSSDGTAVSTTLTIGGVSDTFTSTTGDATPSAFSFVDETGVSLNTTRASAPITVAGINIPAPISVTGGEYQINGGAWVTSAGTVNNGDTVSVRHVTPSAYLTTTNTTLTIRGVSDTFSTTTRGIWELLSVGAWSYGNANPLTLTPALPSGVVSGNALLMYVVSRTGVAPNTPAGWTPIRNDGFRIWLFGKVAGVSESAPNVTWPAGFNVGGASVSRWDCGLTSFASALHIAAQNDFITNQDIDTPALVPTEDNTLILWLGEKDTDVGLTVTPPGGGTLINDVNATGLSSNFWPAWAYKVQSTAASVAASKFDAVSTNTAASFGTVVSLRAAIAAVVNVTDHDTDEIVRLDQTNVVTTGTGFGASQGAGSLTYRQGSVSITQSIDSWGATSIQSDVVETGGGKSLKAGAATLRVTENGTAYGELPITLQLPTGQLYVDLTSVNSTAADRITATPDLAVGDQLQARGVGGGAAPAGLSLYADGTFGFTAGNTPAPFDVRVWDTSDQTLGAWATQSVPDTVAPTAPGTPVVSNVQTNQATVTYTPATDNVGVTAYESALSPSGPWTSRGNVLTFTVTDLAASTAYTVYVRAKDAAGNAGPSVSASFTTLAQPDVDPPTAPGTPTFSAITASGATMSWTAAADNVGVTGYRYRIDGGAWVTLGNVLSTPLSGLAALTAYTLEVAARDLAGNWGSASSATLTTADGTVPGSPGTPAISAITATGCTVTYTAATDNVAVTGYESSVDNGANWTNRGNVLTFNQTGLGQATTYTMRVRAYDAAGNRGPISSATFSTPDVTAPSVPAAPTFASITQTGAVVNWTPASDNVAVTSYRVRLDGALVYEGNTLAYTLSGLSPGTFYEVTVSARDAAGNESAQSSPGALTTAGSVAAPTGVTASLVTTSSATVSWTPPGGSPAPVDYIVRVNGADYPPQTALSIALSGLSPGTLYTITVRARDSLGNSGTQSSALQFTTLVPDTTPPTVPTDVTASAITTSTFTLSWTASTDTSGVAGYNIYRDGVKLTSALVTGTSSARSNLNPGQSYVYTVSAVDILGNESAQSAPVTVTMLNVTPPTTPATKQGRFGGGARRIARPRRRR